MSGFRRMTKAEYLAFSDAGMARQYAIGGGPFGLFQFNPIGGKTARKINDAALPFVMVLVVATVGFIGYLAIGDWLKKKTAQQKQVTQ